MIGERKKMSKLEIAVLCLSMIIASSFLAPTAAGVPKPKGNVTFTKYHTYTEIEQIFREFESNYPDLVKLHIIGKSYLGKNVLALEITNSATGPAESKPGTMLISAHHGNEVITAEIALYYAWYLLSNYPNDPRVKEIIDEKVIYIIPIVNPDGHNITLTTDIYQRWNARPYDNDGDGAKDEDPPDDVNEDGKITEMRVWDNTTHQWVYYFWEGIDNDGDGGINEDWIGGVDLNRNYAYEWVKYDGWHGKKPFSEPETAAVRDFVTNHKNIATALDLHSGTQLVLYPWGYTRKPAPDFTTYMKLGIKYGDLTGYRDMQSGLLYPAFGSAEDWMYGTQGMIYFTNEVFGPALYNFGGWFSGWKWFTMEYPDLYQPWEDVEHPDFPGQRVQVGGFWCFRFFNPPEDEIENWALRNVPMLLSLAEITPKIEIPSYTVELLEEEVEYSTYSITATIQNTGFLATATKQSILTGTAKPVIVEFELGPQAELILGNSVTYLGVLEGGESVTLNWVVKVYEETWITITAISEKGGVDTVNIGIEDNQD
jgi:hypothetical protein